MAVYAFYVGDPGWRKAWRDKLIRWATGSRYSHVELVIDGPLATENETFSASKRDGGRVRKTKITWAPGHWVFVQLPDSATGGRHPYDLIRDLDGAQYDTWGAIGTVIGFFRSHPGRWFCSELMALSLDLDLAETYTPGRFHDAMIAMGGIEIEGREAMNRVKEVAHTTKRTEAADG